MGKTYSTSIINIAIDTYTFVYVYRKILTEIISVSTIAQLSVFYLIFTPIMNKMQKEIG